jgi:phage gp29-like protein
MAENNTPTVPRKLNKEVGESGTLIYAGVITSEEYNRKLTGLNGIRQFEIMRRSDSTVRSALQVVKLPLLSTTWSILPVKQDDGTILPEDQERADFIKRELFHRNVDFFKFLKAGLTCFDFGHSVFEIVAEVTEFNGKTRIGLKKLASRKQSTIFKWETVDQQPGITQIVGSKNMSIPRQKLVIFTHDQEGENYEGISLLRYIYKDWDMKDKLTLVNAMALEKLGVGVPVISARDNMDPSKDDEEDAIDALRNMRANQAAYLKVPKTMQVEMLDLKGNETKDILPTLAYHDRRIMQAILAGFLELGGSAGSGSQSLSKDLSSIFFKSEEAAANQVISTITDDLIKPLCDINFSDNSGGYPQLAFGSIADDDITAMADALSKLMTAGAITADAEIENNVRKRVRLPEMSKEDRDNYKENHQPVDKTEPVEQPSKDKSIPKEDEKKLPKATKEEVKASLDALSGYKAKLIGALAEG